MRGTTPPGAASEQQAAAWVRDMFARVAPRYDLLNHLLSFNADRRWRARAVERVRDRLRRPDARILDLCCGTGDLMLALAAARGGLVFGADFCHPMLENARRKASACRLNAPVFEADALALPLRDASLDVVTVAFGFRNLTNYRRGLGEVRRVLRPGGAAAILEFSSPPNRLFARLYDLYSRSLLTRIGGAISGSRDAYEYLPESVRKFPGAEDLAAEMQAAGFRDVQFERLTLGVVALHIGVR